MASATKDQAGKALKFGRTKDNMPLKAGKPFFRKMGPGLIGVIYPVAPLADGTTTCLDGQKVPANVPNEAIWGKLPLA